jgi:hypothetical protein
MHWVVFEASDWVVGVQAMAVWTGDVGCSDWVEVEMRRERSGILQNTNFFLGIEEV